MKIKLLSTIIAGVILAGCGSDNNNSVTPEVKSKKIQAFDGAVWGIEGFFKCDGEDTVRVGTTDFDGNIETQNETFVNSPEKCTVTFAPQENNPNYKAIDVSNGKDLSAVTYKIPQGLLEAGKKATASPISTLIAEQLGEDGVYDEATAQTVFASLGLSDVVNNGICDSFSDYLQDVDSALKKLKNGDDNSLYSKVLATTVAVSDVQALYPDASPEEIAQVSKNQAAIILHQNPNYPLDENGDELFAEITKEKLPQESFDAQKDKDLTQDEIESAPVIDTKPSTPPEKPEDPTKPPTGGTGGGTGGGDGSSGGGTGN
ncbi:serine/threonine protein kinase [Photobacterium leiognathi subsp. mandapamensis]